MCPSGGVPPALFAILDSDGNKQIDRVEAHQSLAQRRRECVRLARHEGERIRTGQQSGVIGHVHHRQILLFDIDVSSGALDCIQPRQAGARIAMLESA